MGENSNIGWTDHSWSPWRGCTKVSSGCANCYAEALARSVLQNAKANFLWGIISSGIKPYWHPMDRIQDLETWQHELRTVNNPSVPHFGTHFGSFDVLLLDGGEFTSDSDFLHLWNKAGVIALDDTDSRKSVKNRYASGV